MKKEKWANLIILDRIWAELTEIWVILAGGIFLSQMLGCSKDSDSRRGSFGDLGLSLEDRNICFLLLFYDRTVLVG